jgi:hypothetical protein
MDLTTVLRSDVTAARGSTGHIQEAGAHAQGIPDGNVLEVVARDGIELNYTPGVPLTTVLMPHPATASVSL